jgi:hypothetical protein
VLGPISGEHVDAAVVQLHRDLDLNLAVGGAQDLGDVVAQTEAVRCEAEVVMDDLVVGELGPGDRRRAGGRLGSTAVSVNVGLASCGLLGHRSVG